MNEQKGKCLIVLRVRGNVAISKKLEYVFNLLHLNKKNHATLIEDAPSSLGMILKIKDYATWGDISPDTISLLLRERCLTKGNRKLTDDYVKKNLGYDSIEKLAEAIHGSEANFRKLPDIKPVLRLHPPKRGFRKSTKKPYPEGELGYRGEGINQLIERMV